MTIARFVPAASHPVAGFSASKRGGVGLIFALGFPIFTLSVMGAVEFSEVALTRAKLQVVVDSIALTGARELGIDSSDATVERTRLAAQSAAHVVESRWTVTTTASADVRGGAISLTQDGWRPSLFGSLVPPGGFRVRATATARLMGGMPVCVLGLQDRATNSVSLAGASSLKAENCVVQSNGDIAAGGQSTLRASAVRSVGRATGSIAPAPLTDAPRIDDPFAALSIVVPDRCDSSPIALLSGTVTLNPGVHCGMISLIGDMKIILNPGTHYFVGGNLKLLGSTHISGTDVVAIFKGQSAAEFAENSILSLEGRKSGPYAGFVLITDRSFKGDVTISTANAKRLVGTVYLPNATLAIKGQNRVADQSAWTIVVAKNLSLEGQSTLVINSDYAISEVPKPSVLDAVRLTQ